MSFENLPQAIDPGRAMDTITAEEVAFRGEELADDVALGIVLQDTQAAEAFLLSKGHPTSWEASDNLYRDIVPIKPWPGTDVPQANLGMPVVMEAIEKLMPALFLAFFSDKQPFLLYPLGKTTPEAARAKEKLLLWAIKMSGFKEEIRKCLKSALMYGYLLGKWGWKVSTHTKKEYARDETTKKIQKKETEYEVSHPTFENVELRHVLVDASLREQDVRKARHIISQVFITADDLNDMRDDDTYKNIPTREKLAEILAQKAEPTTDSLEASKQTTFRDLQAEKETKPTSIDPVHTPLELLEYVTDDRIITVLQRVIVIRNEKPDFGRKNFLGCAFIDAPGSMYGFGVAKLLSGEQRLQEGVVNAWLNQLALQFSPVFKETTGLVGGEQQVKFAPGRVIKRNLEILQQQSVTKEALDAIQTSELRATRRVGANGGDSMPTQALRTAEGVNAFNQGVVDKLQYFIEIFSDMVFVPALEAMLDVCHDKLQPEDIDRILSEAGAKAYQGDYLDIYNGACEIQVLSSTKLAARRAAAQLVPLLLQFLSAEPVQNSLAAQGKKFNYAELIEQTLDLAGWDVDTLIVDATPEDLQRSMMQQPGAAKAMSAQQEQQQKQQDALQQIEATGEMRAGVAVVQHILKESSVEASTAVPKNILGA